MVLRRLDSTADALDWLAQHGARALTVDSRRVTPGDAFIAWPGLAADGREFVPQALAAGACACLVEADGAEAFESLDRPQVAALPDLKRRTSALASGFLGDPSARLAVVAVTGTNGKTSTAWWIAQALSSLDRRCGVIGTLGVGEPPSPLQPMALEFTGMTTPDPVTVQAGFKRFADAGFKACAIEATSIGLSEHRLDGTHIDVALFTNFTLDHLDYHGSMAAYWAAKAALFAWPGLRAAALNLDDEHGAALAQQLAAAGVLDVWTYSTRAPARLRASGVSYPGGGLGFEVHEGDQRASVRTQMIGDFNVANVLATLGGLRALGVPLADAASACALLTPVPGRMQRIPSDAGGPQVVVDYAHTPDALEKALLALQPFVAERAGELWCVFGCGGNRDPGKRPLMGALAQRLALHVVVTNDNPRNEAPAVIIEQILAGVGAASAGVRVIEDRRAAIAHAVRHAGPHDVILVAGKGHEDTQDIGGQKLHFSDAEEAAAALAARAGGGE
ncbi:MAG: UDP-N-acetylmuramoyl-L-alanyl-D-glutamate--2,6-diaminopimelate ligase [Pseudomonadota bacterium]|nr:UDP-N-acetylmuramoyl-L-alanyl-D-glutamate--2,6-diaminopimelate ligase [Pseudomonadota bacterium]